MNNMVLYIAKGDSIVFLPRRKIWLMDLYTLQYTPMRNRQVTVMVLKATFNNISAISWRSDLLVEETGENH
jgi:hypothetical protein